MQRQVMSPFRINILSEIPTVAGLVLWQNLRYVSDWIGTPPAVRGRMHLTSGNLPTWVSDKRAEARRAAPEIAPALTTLDAWLHAPASMSDEHLAASCEVIAKWAYSNNHLETGESYADAAWQLQPLSFGIFAAKMARDTGNMVRAERLFGRVIKLARGENQWKEYIRAHLGLGILYMQTKQDQRARKYLEHAANKARREGFEWLAAEAQHDLFQYMTVRGHLDAAETHARAALAWYPKHNPRLPFLIADAAFLLILKQHYSQAIELLRPFLRVKNTPPQNLLGLSMLVRALGAAGHHRKFAWMRRRLLREIPDTPVEAAARWHLAEGERAMGRWREAAREAAQSLSLSLALNDYETAEFAEKTLRDAKARQSPRGEVPHPEPRVVEFVRLLVARIDEWAPTKRGRPRGSPGGWDY
jgi:tetratricopeptide (TPR) repeat protein